MSDQVAVDLQDRTPEHSTFYNCEIHLEECDCNGRSFESGTVPAKQELSMSRPKSQTCKLCGKVLASPSSYYVHLKLHSGNKPFQCKQCEACFSRKPYLEAHMRSHTGERPFQCTVCLKWFSQKSSLNTHKRVHTGERPYSCDLCDKKFAVKSYVTAHRWSHLGDKPLVCQKCNITFTSKHEFALHDRIHVTGTDFECHMCGRVFSKESYLIRHINRVHQDSKDTRNDIQAHASFMNGMCTDSRRRNATSTCGDPNFQTISVGSTAPIDANLTSDMPPNVMSLNHFMIPC